MMMVRKERRWNRRDDMWKSLEGMTVLCLAFASVLVLVFFCGPGCSAVKLFHDTPPNLLLAGSFFFFFLNNEMVYVYVYV